MLCASGFPAGTWQAPSLKFYLDNSFTLDNDSRADSRRCPRISQETSSPKSHKEGRTP
ncbi:transposase [Pseudomonas sp. IT-194MI4]